MSNYLTEGGEMSRRYELDERCHHRPNPTHPAPRRRTRVATGLRRVADLLDQ